MMKKQFTYLLLASLLLLASYDGHSQRRNRGAASAKASSLLADSVFSGLALRNIGPAFMSGRIADIAIDPTNESIWYVAVGSGGVWKTKNAGVTWKPVFDEQKSYSIGCVTVDPNNPNTIWVGTGENVGGRHVGYGDGIYLSLDGGETWKNMGLKLSEHISKIVVHPNDPNIIWAAVQGPLWKKGGERGLYLSTNGGKSWERTLGDNAWVGVTDLVLDPTNSNRIYAATWQRHRTVAAYMGGGPGSGIHRSVDGGKTWTQLSQGLPKKTMGKIGLAISQNNPKTVYAAIELERRTGGVYRSTDGGSSWEKRSDAVAGATGPHYYQELYASPHQEGTLYLVDNWMQVSRDGGKTFTRLNNKHKHGDNHAVAFKNSEPDYLLVGTDGGVYESFDLGDHWRFMDNLPVTQYYKVALDDTAPFYNIYGGTQDNSTQRGPSRTDNVHGIQNADWSVVLNWDGHQPATEPGNPDIVYAERQEGNLSRLDMITGEVIDIQPQPGPNEGHERFNWDAPILVSPHSPSTIYFASYRVWKSENRGDAWEAISGDLTKNEERITLPIMGKKQSWDAPWDFLAMSNYNTITSIAESPKQAGLIYAGTDDGLIQVTENGGSNWRKIAASQLPGVPATAFVNDIKADLYDANTVYVALDNHKYGDFKPYLFKSTDRGRTWRPISNGIPQGTLVWRVVQDHVKPELMFAATEFGIYFTIDAGTKWVKLTGGVPTISFRDLAIQKRENDLVGASFGRGFFVLDDYSPLRGVSEKQLNEEATLFATRDAWWYVPRPQLSFDDLRGSQGASHYVAPNPDFGATFTYYLKDGLKTQQELRQEAEKKLKKQNQNVPFPGWEQVAAEKHEQQPKIWLTISDNQGNVVRRITGPVTKGFHRIAWDLRYPAPEVIKAVNNAAEFGDTPKGLMAAPGTYIVAMTKQVNGVVTPLSTPVTFQVKPLRKGALPGHSPEVAAQFWREYEAIVRATTAVELKLSNAIARAKALSTALLHTRSKPGDLDVKLESTRKLLIEAHTMFSGNAAKLEPGEKTKPTISERVFALYKGVANSTYGPTQTHNETVKIVKNQLKTVTEKVDSGTNALDQLAKEIIKAGGPAVEGSSVIAPAN